MKNEPKLLSRQVFSEAVLNRDNHTCVFCKDTKVVVHHIIEKKLFGDGGYYIDNGASVCDEHHWSFEKTDINVEEVSLACKIKTIIISEHFDINIYYDKWVIQFCLLV